MTPEELSRAMRRFERWQQLPAERRDHIRQQYSRFMELPRHQREHLRKRYKDFATMPEKKAGASKNVGIKNGNRAQQATTLNNQQNPTVMAGITVRTPTIGVATIDLTTIEVTLSRVANCL